MAAHVLDDAGRDRPRRVRRGVRGLAFDPWPGPPGGSSCSATTPTTTAASSWPPPSTDRPWSSAGRRRGDRPGSASANFGEVDAFDVDRGRPRARHRRRIHAWGRYVRGVTWAIREAYGPPSVGLRSRPGRRRPDRRRAVQLGEPCRPPSPCSSPAPGSVRRGRSGEADRLALAQTLRRSENEFVGVASGLLDQFSALFGKAGHAFILDCLDPRPRPPAAGQPRARPSSSATRRPRDAWPTGCTTADGPRGRRVVEHFRESEGASTGSGTSAT